MHLICARRLCVLAFILLSAIRPVAAETADETAISKILHAALDQPNVAVTIGPTVVSGDHAIADWVHGDMGGRALLRRNQKTWELTLCAGDIIKTSASIMKGNVPAVDAIRLEQQLNSAEAGLGPDKIAMFSRFNGLSMGGCQHHHH